MAGPATAAAYSPAETRNSTPVCWPNVLMMVPMSKLSKQPLGHGAHGVDAVPVRRQNDILAAQKCCNLFHVFLSP